MHLPELAQATVVIDLVVQRAVAQLGVGADVVEPQGYLYPLHPSLLVNLAQQVGGEVVPRLTGDAVRCRSDDHQAPVECPCPHRDLNQRIWVEGVSVDDDDLLVSLDEISGTAQVRSFGTDDERAHVREKCGGHGGYRAASAHVRQEVHEMSSTQGQHVWAGFPGGEVEAVVLEVRGDDLIVQEDGTSRAERIAASKCRGEWPGGGRRAAPRGPSQQDPPMLSGTRRRTGLTISCARSESRAGNRSAKLLGAAPKRVCAAMAI